jgi:activator of HSP90 ATPase
VSAPELESFEVSTVLPAEPEEVYRAWLDGARHTAFTGARAEVQARVGGRFTAGDGYIEGRTLAMESRGQAAGGRPAFRILQSWRTTEFPAGSPDSRLEVLLEKDRGGTRITLKHSEIPAGQGAEYAQGWADHYFTPMMRYFSGKKDA